MFDLLQTTKRRQGRFMHRRSRLEMDVLVQQSELHSTRADHLASIRCLFTSDETEDRAFAGAVATDQSDVFAGIDLQRRAA
jgi:hypothetical protein